MYPVPFRRMGEEQRYKKYDWLECRLARNTSDPRPETFRPVDQDELSPVAHMDTRDKWRQRRNLILKKCRVYDRLDELISGAKSNQISLAVFKPTRVLDFVWEEDEREWKPERVREMRERTKQRDLFEDNTWRETFRLIDKLPYKFSYRFEDATGKRSELQILDWEAGALFWNCLRNAPEDEGAALAKVRQKYFDEFLKTDLHFFMGTTQQWHQVAPNPWIIVGTFHVPHEQQLGLFGG